MESSLTYITNYLLTQSWQIALLTIVIAFISFLLRTRSAHIRYILWLIVLAKCLIPPLYTVSIAILPEKAAAYTSAPLIIESFNQEYGLPDIPAVTESIESAPVHFETRALLAIGWLIGVAALAFYYLINALRTQIWLNNRRRAIPVEYKKNIESLFITYGVRRIPRLWFLDKISQPFVWGLVRGSIYLPAEMINENYMKFHTSLIGHELSHVIRFDALINSLQVIAQTIFWFHPFVWWTNRKIRIEREKCCDEMTIASLNTLPEDYSEAIVEILAAKYEQTRRVPSLAVAGKVKNIEERIKILLMPGKKFYRRPTIAAVLIIFFIALLAIPTALVLTTRVSLGNSAIISDNIGVTPVPASFDISSASKLDDPTSWIPKTNGCLIEQTGSKIHIVGTNNIEGWGHNNGVASTKVLPEGDFYACVNFMVPDFSGTGNTLVYLRAASTTDNSKMIAILYQPKAGTYQVQGWGMGEAPNTFSQPPLRKIGDEDRAFHRMKLKYDATAKTAFGWLDDKFIGYLNYPMTGPVKFELLANTETKGMKINLFFDNLSLSSDFSEAPSISYITSGGSGND